MIVTVTPNPALDITYRVAGLVRGESHRITEVVERAGGKGLNTAGVLTTMGHAALAVAPVGSPALEAFGADLSARGIEHVLVPTRTPTRRSVAVVDDSGAATLLNEVGSPLPDDVWTDLLTAVRGAAAAPFARVLTVSGSLPPQAPPDIVRTVVAEAHRAGLAVVLDVSGPQLLSALEAGPEIVKPNRSEAAATLGRGEGDDLPAAALARALASSGARAAIVSDGAAGLALATGPLALRAWLERPLQGNATGAGDAATAALAADLDSGGALSTTAPDATAWREALARAVAWSAAAVLQPVAGSIDPTDVDRLLPAVQIQETPA